MTAAAMPEDIDRCKAAGMTGHIAKPIRQEELLQATLQQLAARDIVDAA
jgi:CheY-like chemotaxis protein